MRRLRWVALGAPKSKSGQSPKPANASWTRTGALTPSGSGPRLSRRQEDADHAAREKVLRFRAVDRGMGLECIPRRAGIRSARRPNRIPALTPQAIGAFASRDSSGFSLCRAPSACAAGCPRPGARRLARSARFAPRRAWSRASSGRPSGLRSSTRRGDSPTPSRFRATAWTWPLGNLHRERAKLPQQAPCRAPSHFGMRNGRAVGDPGP
jgi:hypothetical protein